MNVLVYSGPEVNQSSQSSAIRSLRGLLVPNYVVQPLSQHALISQPWSPTCALLVLPACRSISSTAIVKSYVENGGRLLAFSIGVRGLRGDLITTLEDLAISNEGSLTLRDAAGNGHIALDFNYWSDKDSISLDLECGGTRIQGVPCHSPRPSLPNLDTKRDVSVLGRFPDDTIAGIKYSLGSGNAVMWAVHLETTLTGDAEEQRLTVLRRSLQECGLHIPTHPMRKSPLPQFLVGKSSIVTRIVEELWADPTAEEAFIVQDENDTVHFHSSTQCPSLLQKCRDADTPSWKPKHIIMHLDGTFPLKDQTPLFDFELYFEHLSKARGGRNTNDVWGIGDALLYGEVVTSTQTMLEKNPWLLSHLSSPLVSLASHQLEGRGRGANTWLSPSGCLQFSLLLRVPFSSVPASKLVFVQYLFCLAVTEACRDDSILGKWGECVRLKWPNDLYVLVEGENKKIGGILVNTSFSNGKAEVVIGCGLNILNPPPITSLSQSVPPDVHLELRMERTAATILAKFEPMWNTFVAHHGSFEPFMDLYLQRWLHSNQIVTLTTPERKVRITGITNDYGLLRTIPEKSGDWVSGKDEGFIDLQPDGNSFDIMSGLIKSKT